MSFHLPYPRLLACILLLFGGFARADEKQDSVRSGVAQEASHDAIFARPATGETRGCAF